MEINIAELNQHKVSYIDLPTNMEKRLEAMSMTNGTSVTVLNNKNHGALIVKVRGTRFALGRNITRNILALSAVMFWKLTIAAKDGRGAVY